MTRHSSDELVSKLKAVVGEARVQRLEKDRSKPCRIVIMGVDTSKFSHEAVEWARKYNYITPDDIVILATVWEEALEQYITTVDMGLYAGLVSIDKDEIRQHNEEALEAARKCLREMYDTYLKGCEVFPLIVSSSNVAKASIGDTLCKTADALEANCIIVGCHGHGAFKRFLLGSVSKYVVQNACCPVLVVKH